MSELEGSVSLQITGKCKNCPALDPIVSKLFFGADALNVISCRNTKLCASLEKHIREQLLKEES